MQLKVKNMAKSSKEQILKDEKKIIAELQKNSRASADKIAKKCGFSRQKAWRILNSLEKDKVIWGYGTVTDNEKLGISEYHILIKKTTEPLAKTVDTIISRQLDKDAETLGINIECSHYLHGQYDWEICFTAENIKIAKKFCELLNKLYYKSISELILIERMFSAKKCGILNPNLEKLKEFI